MNLPIAHPTATPDEYRAECPATHREYIGRVRLRTWDEGRPAVWLNCACCDAYGHTSDLSLTEPQPHFYLDGTAQTFVAGGVEMTAAEFGARLMRLRESDQ